MRVGANAGAIYLRENYVIYFVVFLTLDWVFLEKINCGIHYLILINSIKFGLYQVELSYIYIYVNVFFYYY